MGKTGFFICSAGAVLIVVGVASAVDFQETPDTSGRGDFNANTAVSFCDITARRRLKPTDRFRGGEWRTAFDKNTGIASITRQFISQNGDGVSRNRTYRCIVNTFTNLVSNFEIADGHL